MSTNKLISNTIIIIAALGLISCEAQPGLTPEQIAQQTAEQNKIHYYIGREVNIGLGEKAVVEDWNHGSYKVRYKVTPPFMSSQTSPQYETRWIPASVIFQNNTISKNCEAGN